MPPLTLRTKTYLMVLAVTLAGAAACWFLLTQIDNLYNDSDAVASLPFKNESENQNNWRYYIDNFYGVGIKYPTSYSVADEGPGNFKLLPQKKDPSLSDNLQGIWVYLINNSDESTLRKVWDGMGFNDGCYYDPKDQNVEDVGILFFNRDSKCGKFPFYSADLLVGKNNRIVYISTRSRLIDLKGFVSSINFIDSKNKIITDAPISYASNNKLFSVTKKQFSINDVFTAKSLFDSARECGENKPISYYDKLLHKFSENDFGYSFEFAYTKKTDRSIPYTITILPNKLNYKEFKDFENDFGLCEAGGGLYPSELSPNFLLFRSACSTGFDGGGGCDEVESFVDSSIKLTK